MTTAPTPTSHTVTRVRRPSAFSSDRRSSDPRAFAACVDSIAIPPPPSSSDGRAPRVGARCYEYELVRMGTSPSRGTSRCVADIGGTHAGGARPGTSPGRSALAPERLELALRPELARGVVELHELAVRAAPAVRERVALVVEVRTVAAVAVLERRALRRSPRATATAMAHGSTLMVAPRRRGSCRRDRRCATPRTRARTGRPRLARCDPLHALVRPQLRAAARSAADHLPRLRCGAPSRSHARNPRRRDVERHARRVVVARGVQRHVAPGRPAHLEHPVEADAGPAHARPGPSPHAVEVDRALLGAERDEVGAR